MASTTINDSQGVITTSGTGLSIQNNVQMSSLPTSPVQALTSSDTIVNPGVYTVSGSAVLTLTMPLASSVPGGLFVFRTISVHAHALTGSAESSGTRVFTDGTTLGSRVALTAVAGNSVSLISDGKNFCVLAKSGSLSFSGT